MLAVITKRVKGQEPGQQRGAAPQRTGARAREPCGFIKEFQAARRSGSGDVVGVALEKSSRGKFPFAVFAEDFEAASNLCLGDGGVLGKHGGHGMGLRFYPTISGPCRCRGDLDGHVHRFLEIFFNWRRLSNKIHEIAFWEFSYHLLKGPSFSISQRA